MYDSYAASNRMIASCCLAHATHFSSCARGDRAGGVVRRAQVDDVHAEVRRIGLEAVRLVPDEVGQAGIATIRPRGRRASRHHVRIDVHRVHRIGDRDARREREDLLDVAAVALAAIADEDLVGRDVHAARGVVVLADRFDEEVVALLRAVAAERLALAHLVDGGVHRLDDRGRERLGHIADAEADDLRVGVRRRVRAHATTDLGEQITRRQLGVVLVDTRPGARR